ncbi:MAG: UMP kinase [Candidatus Bathyarchaeia archaeon]
MKIVLKLGGFAFTNLGNAEALISDYVKLLKKLSNEHHIVVVTGGGAVARSYIRAARAMETPESLCDQLGILVSRLNARLLVDGLGDQAFPEIPATIAELKHYFVSGKLVAMGGLQPGHSTNAVAALAAETVKANLFLNVTDVDGVYTADPSIDPAAKRLDEVNVKQLADILSKHEMTAGSYDLMDPIALRIIARSKIPTIILNGRIITNITKAIQNEKIGTKIMFS